MKPWAHSQAAPFSAALAEMTCTNIAATSGLEPEQPPLQLRLVTVLAAAATTTAVTAVALAAAATAANNGQPGRLEPSGTASQWIGDACRLLAKNAVY